MTRAGRFSDWTFSVREVVAAIGSAITLTTVVILWSFSSFQTKAEARTVEIRVDAIESDVKGMRSSSEAIARDMSYIKGLLEAKFGKNK